MDIELEKSINEAIEKLAALSPSEEKRHLADPIAKMMLAALMYETQKIRDHMNGIGQRIAERFSEDFIPRRNIEATPAIALIEPKVKVRKDSEPVTIDSGAVFVYKTGIGKNQLNYIPLFRSTVLPYSDLYVLTQKKMRSHGVTHEISMEKPNVVWIGINTAAEIEEMKGITLLIKGTGGIAPEHLFTAGHTPHELGFSTTDRMEDFEMAEPFDAQQASGTLFSIIEGWREQLGNMPDAALLQITDQIHDRDLFKPLPYPRMFQSWLESEVLDCFAEHTVWIRLVFPEQYAVPDTCTVTLNAVPAVNIDVNSVTLTQATPVAKLQKQDDSFFLRVLETSNTAHRQGFGMISDEIVIRDFDAACYHNGDLYRDVRNLCNRFTEDYHAFIEYNGIKDGELIKQLKEVVNRIGKSVGVQNSKYKFDSGTFAMKNINQFPPSSSTKVTYITTQGKVGNTPQAGETMENRKLPSIEKDVPIIISAAGGSDKASADERYEQLRYYSLTIDRLYTKRDIDAFLRKEILAEFGKEEFRRIFTKIHVEGYGGEKELHRGLYIDIEFKDRKNYDRAAQIGFDQTLHHRISDRSCISMPIIVRLSNLEL